MDKIRFLFDEDIPALLAEALRRQEPGIDILSVGDDDGPGKRTEDAVLLELAAARDRILVTRDKKTMPGHLVDFYRTHEHNPGVIMIRSNSTLADVVEHLHLFWVITAPDEWTDCVEVIPYLPKRNVRRARRR